MSEATTVARCEVAEALMMVHAHCFFEASEDATDRRAFWFEIMLAIIGFSANQLGYEAMLAMIDEHQKTLPRRHARASCNDGAPGALAWRGTALMAGWIGVDLDGTLAMFNPNVGVHVIGPPVPVMLARVKQWLAQGREVRIFTARVGACMRTNEHGTVDDNKFADVQRAMIEAWSLQHIGSKLVVTATKDFDMLELWDDRAVQVMPNTGQTYCEYWHAQA